MPIVLGSKKETRVIEREEAIILEDAVKTWTCKIPEYEVEFSGITMLPERKKQLSKIHQDKTVEELLSIHLSEIITGWKGIVDTKGKDIPCTPENISSAVAELGTDIRGRISTAIYNTAFKEGSSKITVKYISETTKQGIVTRNTKRGKVNFDAVEQETLEYLITDWEGVFRTDGTPAELNKENIKLLPDTIKLEVYDEVSKPKNVQ